MLLHYLRSSPAKLPFSFDTIIDTLNLSLLILFSG